MTAPYLPRSDCLLRRGARRSYLGLRFCCAFFFSSKERRPAGRYLAAAMAFAALLDGLQIKSHEEVLADFKAHPQLVDYADAFAGGVETGAQRATQAQLQLELGIG